MSIELTWYGHGTWQISLPEHTLLLDPFLNDNPSSPVKESDVDADFILVSHGHFDHIADAASVANRNNATVIAIFEVAQWLNQNHAVQETVGMNIGGGVTLPFGHVKMTPAFHSSQLPDGSYGGEPAGFLLNVQGKRIYFACDTGLFSDMKLIGQLGLDLAVLPIGDLFTMGPEDSLEAIKLLQPKKVAPAHFNTWPPIEQDAAAWAKRVESETQSEPIVLNPGGQFSL